MMELDRGRRVSLAVSTAAALYAVVGGLLTLAGWAIEAPRLTDWLHHGISMFPNAATCAALSGLAILLRNLLSRRFRPAIQALSAFVALVGALTLTEHLTGTDLKIDTALFNRHWGQLAASAPMRMGPPASLSYLLIGVALLLLTCGRRARAAASAIAILVAAVATLSLVGFLYGAHQMYTVPRVTGIAMQTASMLFALAIATVASAPDVEPMQALLDPGAAGKLARRALPLSILLALGLGWLRVMAQDHNLVDTAFGTALRTIIEIALLTGLLWWAAVMVRAHTHALSQSEAELAENARRKDEFLATLAHELRNPLAPIRNGLEALPLLQDRPEELVATRAMMLRQLHHLVRLVDDLLDASRISRGKLQLRKEHVELEPVIHEALEACRPQFEAGRLRLEVSLPPEAIYLDADPVRLAQVFGNLLGNAAKFTSPDCQVWLTARRDQGQVVISVKDTGIGISPDMLPRVFDMFMQVDQPVGRSQGGLGIGLSLVKRLVEMHGGQVEACSHGEGKGSEFVVRLPILDSAPEPTPVPLSKRIEPLLRRILVVDDNQDSARTLAMLLKYSGSDTQVAHDGPEAVEKAAQYRPDVVLLDIGLPTMSGYDVCRAIRSNSAGARPAIIALTGWGQEEDRKKSKEAGFDAHLVKPIDYAVLTDLLQSLPAGSVASD